MRIGVGRRPAAGVTLPEVLVVVTIIALAVAIAMPVISDAIRSAKVRSAANGFAVSLKAARMLAVTTHRPVEVRVFDSSTQNAYEYTGRNGRLLRFGMPAGVRIEASTSPIVFMPTGAVNGGAQTTLEVDMDRDRVETWRITTSSVGLSTVSTVEGGS